MGLDRTALVLGPLSVDMLIVLAILALTIVLFVTEVVRVDVAAVASMVALGLTGVLPGSDVFAGFASNAVISVMAVMVIGAALDRVGIMRDVAGFIQRFGSGSERRLVASSTFTAGLISGFMQNIGAAALFLPVMERLSREQQGATGAVLDEAAVSRQPTRELADAPVPHPATARTDQTTVVPDARGIVGVDDPRRGDPGARLIAQGAGEALEAAGRHDRVVVQEQDLVLRPAFVLELRQGQVVAAGPAQVLRRGQDLDRRKPLAHVGDRGVGRRVVHQEDPQTGVPALGKRAQAILQHLAAVPVDDHDAQRGCFSGGHGHGSKPRDAGC